MLSRVDIKLRLLSLLQLKTKLLGLVVLILIIVVGSGVYYFSKQRTATVQKKYEDCFNPASSIASPREIELIEKCLTVAAQALEAEAEFSHPIEIAQKIPQDSSRYNRAQKYINVRSVGILKKATEVYQKEANLSGALKMIDLIPATSPVKQEATKRSQEWEEEYQKNLPLIQLAERALVKQQWQQAIDSAKQVTGPVNWENWARQIINIATQKNITPTVGDLESQPECPEGVICLCPGPFCSE
ncbi:MAG: hypothetical protein QNJ34_03640 [Xenococcaceae cyanobacterium MO_188.B29]|nr:hypothetical protein [Xenococcaceae cyanobacterium MO_188.B29]